MREREAGGDDEPIFESSGERRVRPQLEQDKRKRISRGKRLEMDLREVGMKCRQLRREETYSAAILAEAKSDIFMALLRHGGFSQWTDEQDQLTILGFHSARVHRKQQLPAEQHQFFVEVLKAGLTLYRRYLTLQ